MISKIKTQMETLKITQIKKKWIATVKVVAIKTIPMTEVARQKLKITPQKVNLIFKIANLEIIMIIIMNLVRILPPQVAHIQIKVKIHIIKIHNLEIWIINKLLIIITLEANNKKLLLINRNRMNRSYIYHSILSMCPRNQIS